MRIRPEDAVQLHTLRTAKVLKTAARMAPEGGTINYVELAIRASVRQVLVREIISELTGQGAWRWQNERNPGLCCQDLADPQRIALIQAEWYAMMRYARHQRDDQMGSSRYDYQPFHFPNPPTPEQEAEELARKVRAYVREWKTVRWRQRHPGQPCKRKHHRPKSPLLSGSRRGTEVLGISEIGTIHGTRYRVRPWDPILSRYVWVGTFTTIEEATAALTAWQAERGSIPPNGSCCPEAQDSIEGTSVPVHAGRQRSTSFSAITRDASS